MTRSHVLFFTLTFTFFFASNHANAERIHTFDKNKSEVQNQKANTDIQKVIDFFAPLFPKAQPGKKMRKQKMENPFSGVKKAGGTIFGIFKKTTTGAFRTFGNLLPKLKDEDDDSATPPDTELPPLSKQANNSNNPSTLEVAKLAFSRGNYQEAYREFEAILRVSEDPQTLREAIQTYILESLY